MTTARTWTAAAALIGITDAKDDRDAQRRIYARVNALGLAVCCTRCGGGGHYSRNAMGSTLCYSCNGAGKVLPKLTDKLLASVKTRTESGELDAWFAANRARTAAKRALNPIAKAVWSAWSDGIGAEYEVSYKSSRRGNTNIPEDLFRANSLAGDIASAASDLTMGNYSTLAPEEKVARAQELLAMVNALTAAWAEYKAPATTVALDWEAEMRENGKHFAEVTVYA